MKHQRIILKLKENNVHGGCKKKSNTSHFSLSISSPYQNEAISQILHSVLCQNLLNQEPHINV